MHHFTWIEKEKCSAASIELYVMIIPCSLFSTFVICFLGKYPSLNVDFVYPWGPPYVHMYTRGLWKHITIFLHFSRKLYMGLKSYSQVLMCNPELVWISHLFDCTMTRRYWWRHMGTYSIQHLSSQINEAFWLFLCLNCGVYGAMLPKEFIDFF